MFNHIGTVCVFVEDQDRAKAFYTNVLGMEVHQDMPVFPGAPNRWLSVKPHGATTELILYKIDKNWEHYIAVVGKSQAVTFDVSNILGLIADLKSKGVTVVVEPDVQPWGTNAMIKDSEGNTLLLVETPHQG